MDALKKVGWDDAWADSFKVYASAGLSPARVAAREGSLYRLWTEGGDRDGAISGKFKLALSKGGKLPAVGDWVAVDLKQDQGVIQGVLPRRTMVSRKEAGERDRMQVLVANVDVIFVVSGLDGDFNLRRLERYLAVVREGGSKGVVLLNKADLCAETPQRLAETILVARDLPVHVISAKKGEGVDVLEQYLKPTTTVALLGSSGAGKSTLVNRILGREKQATKETREDSRGRHTTTSREMFLTPGGAILLDTPGLREIQLADVAEGIRQTFSDIETLFGACKFDNCRHHKEPGCAILAAMDAGNLDPLRWDSYLKLKGEQAVRGMKDWQKRRHDRKFARVVDEALKRKGRPK